MPNRYDASAVVQIDPRHKIISNLDTVVSDLKGDRRRSKAKSRSSARVRDPVRHRDARPAQRPRVQRAFPLEPAAIEMSASPQTTALKRNPEREAPIARDQIAEVLNPNSPAPPSPRRDEVAVAFAERLKVVRVQTRLLIDIRFSASDPAKAAKIANTIAETYLRQQIDVKRRADAAATEMLEGKIEEMRGKVADAERNGRAMEGTQQHLRLRRPDPVEKQMARLMEQTVNARNATAEARAKYEQAQKLARSGDDGNAIAEVLKSPTVQALKDQLASTRPQGRRTRHPLRAQASRTHQDPRRGCRRPRLSLRPKSTGWSPT